MGQRLVVTIKKKNRNLAKIYYHWSAYTTSALQEVKDIIDNLYDADFDIENKTAKRIQLRLVDFCEGRGGGIRGDDKEFEYISNLFLNRAFKKDGYSRNNGLIALSSVGMRDLQDWAEESAEINLDAGVVSFGVFCCYDSLEEYNRERLEWDEDYTELKPEDVIDIGHCLWEFSINDVDDIINNISCVNNHVCRYGSEIYNMIE